ncbi:MAG TPA: DNA primase [Moraxellaceae bacterium]|nr:DNA primase [Moraxellaceae bacterium]
MAAYGRIPESFIDDVLLRTDIVDLIDSRVKLKKAGKNYSACCPFHREKSPSFTVSREKQFYYCFGCGASGNAVSFLMDYERKGFLDALNELAGRVGLDVPDTRDPDAAPRESQQPLYDLLETAAKYFEQQLRTNREREKAVGYFKKRGLTGAIAKLYRLGYSPPGWDNLLTALGNSEDSKKNLLATGLVVRNEQSNRIYDAMRDRVIFPIRDFRGRVIAFGGRVLTDEKPKYLNSPESPVFHKGQELYGLYEARMAPGKLERVIVVEGYMDVVALAQYGITNAVATLGTATSTTHVERLLRLVPEICFCFDGDEAGRKAAWRALESALPAMQDGKSASFLFLPAGEDPDSLVRKEGTARFQDRVQNEAEPLADFMFRHLGEGLNTESLEGRSRLTMLAKPLVATLPDGLYREMLLQRLAEFTRLELATLRAAVLDTPPIPATRSQAPAPRQTAPDEASGIPDYFTDTNDSQPQNGYGKRPRFEPRQRQGRQPYAPRVQTLGLPEQAVRLLLQDPKQASLTSSTELLALRLPEDCLLIELIRLLENSPGISTPALLGAWHGTELGDELTALAASEFLTPNVGVDLELRGVLGGLRLAAMEAELRECTDLETIQRLKKAIEALKQAPISH